MIKHTEIRAMPIIFLDQNELINQILQYLQITLSSDLDDYLSNSTTFRLFSKIII
jgi:hypothetical protein